jgi:hypothetical protein
MMKHLIWVNDEAIYFWQLNWTDEIRLKKLNKFSVRRRRGSFGKSAVRTPPAECCEAEHGRGAPG